MDDADVERFRQGALDMLRGQTVHELIANTLDVNLSVMGMNVTDRDVEALADRVIAALELAGFTISRNR